MANRKCNCKKQNVNQQTTISVKKTIIEEGVGPKPGSPLND